jgi:hypothetical protein
MRILYCQGAELWSIETPKKHPLLWSVSWAVSMVLVYHPRSFHRDWISQCQDWCAPGLSCWKRPLCLVLAHREKTGVKVTTANGSWLTCFTEIPPSPCLISSLLGVAPLLCERITPPPLLSLSAKLDSSFQYARTVL